MEHASKSTLSCTDNKIFSASKFIKVITFAGFLGEVFDDGAYFIDSDGNFRKLVYLQHMSIYGAFIVHGLIDLAEFYKFPVIKGSNYMSMCLAFFW